MMVFINCDGRTVGAATIPVDMSIERYHEVEQACREGRGCAVADDLLRIRTANPGYPDCLLVPDDGAQPVHATDVPVLLNSGGVTYVSAETLVTNLVPLGVAHPIRQENRYDMLMVRLPDGSTGRVMSWRDEALHLRALLAAT